MHSAIPRVSTGDWDRFRLKPAGTSAFPRTWQQGITNNPNNNEVRAFYIAAPPLARQAYIHTLASFSSLWAICEWRATRRVSPNHALTACRPDKRGPRLFSRDKRLPKTPRPDFALNRLSNRHARAHPFLLGHLREASATRGKGGPPRSHLYSQRPTSKRTRSPRTPQGRPRAYRLQAGPGRAGALRTARPSRPRRPAGRRTAWQTRGAGR